VEKIRVVGNRAVSRVAPVILAALTALAVLTVPRPAAGSRVLATVGRQVLVVRSRPPAPT